jgi:hypothetical protein
MAGRPLKYPFDVMVEGEERLIKVFDKYQLMSLRAAATSYGRRYGRRYAIRRIGRAGSPVIGARLWRLSDPVDNGGTHG